MSVPVASSPGSGRRGPGRPPRQPQDPASALGRLGGLIRDLRTDRGLTLARLSALTGYSLQHLGAVERGQVAPSESVVSACERALAAGGQLTAAFPAVVREQARARHIRGQARHGAGPVPENGDQWPGLVAAVRRSSAITGAMTGDLEQITDRHRALYHELSSGEMLGPVEAHLSLLTSLMRGSQPEPLRHRVASAAAEAAGLAAWLWLDLGDQARAAMRYEMASGLLGQAANPALGGYVTGYRVLAAGAACVRAQAVCLAEMARAQTPLSASRLMRSWLAAVSASAAAQAGDQHGALKLIGQARDLFDTAGDREEWMYDFDLSSLALYQGQCYLQAGQPREAMSAFETGLAGLPGSCARRRAVLMAELARACVPTGQLDAAISHAGQALDLFALHASAAGLDRIREFCEFIDAAGYQREARELQLRLAEYLPERV
jgi:transcriptional regulator with XRE-family HTH domain